MPAVRRARSASAMPGSAASRARERARVVASSTCLRARPAASVPRLRAPVVAEPDLAAAAAEQLLEVAEHVVGLLAAAGEDALEDVLRVVGGHPAARDRVLEDLLDRVAGDHDHVERRDQPRGERLAQLGDVLAGEVEPAGLGGGRRLGGGGGRLAGLLARGLLAAARLAAGLRRAGARGAAPRGRALARGRPARPRGRRRSCAPTRTSSSWPTNRSTARTSSCATSDDDALRDDPAPDRDDPPRLPPLFELPFDQPCLVPPPAPRYEPGLCHLEARFDGRVIGQPHARSVRAHDLALLGAQAARRGRTSSPRASRWSTASGAVGGASPNCSRSSSNAHGCSRRAQVHVAADRRAAASGSHATHRAARPSSSSAARRVVALRGRVHVRHAQRRARRARDSRAQIAVRRSGRRASSTRRTSPIRHGGRTSSWFDPPSFDAIRSGFQSATSVRANASELREVSTDAPLAPVAARERAKPARRRLLEQRDVPLPRRELGLRTPASSERLTCANPPRRHSPGRTR